MIKELIIKTPSLSHVLKPTLEWLDEKSDVLRVQEASNRNANIKNVWLQSDALINSVLIVAQSVKEPQGLANEDLDLTENAFGIAETSLKQLVKIARVESITGEINKLFDLLSRSPSQHINSSSVALKRSVPFIRQYIKWLSNELDRMMSWHKASLKFAHILASTFLSVAEKGFCKPDEKDNGESDEQGDGKLEEGTGLGEGEGAENISNQIQNEEQVEGLKDEGGEGDEKNDDEKEKTEAEDQAIEMNEDFDGDLDDASDRDGEEGEERDEENMDEQMGDADPLDPGAVDEKMWNDENDQESGDKDDHVDNDAKGQGESETVANEDTKQSNKEDKPEQGEEAGEEEAEQQNEMGDEKEEMPEAQDEVGIKIILFDSTNKHRRVLVKTMKVQDQIKVTTSTTSCLNLICWIFLKVWISIINKKSKKLVKMRMMKVSRMVKWVKMMTWTMLVKKKRVNLRKVVMNRA